LVGEKTTRENEGMTTKGEYRGRKPEGVETSWKDEEDLFAEVSHEFGDEVKGYDGEDEDDGEGEYDDGITVNEKDERWQRFEKVEASRRTW